MYKEKVTCVDCKHSYEREPEILKNRYSNIEIPIEIAIIKTSICPNCKSKDCKVNFIYEQNNIKEKAV